MSGSASGQVDTLTAPGLNSTSPWSVQPSMENSHRTRCRAATTLLVLLTLLSACQEEREAPRAARFSCRLTIGPSFEPGAEIRIERGPSEAHAIITTELDGPRGPEERAEDVWVDTSIADGFRQELRRLSGVPETDLDYMVCDGTMFFVELREGDGDEPVLVWRLHQPYRNPAGRQWKTILAVRDLLRAVELDPETRDALRHLFASSFGLGL